MGSWGITMRESDYGLDLLSAIVNRQLKALDFSTFKVADALEVIKADIMEEIRLANRGCSAADLAHYFSENFPHNFTQGALLIAECLADYYRTGELVVYDYVGENYDPVEHYFRVSTKPQSPIYSTIPQSQRMKLTSTTSIASPRSY